MGERNEPAYYWHVADLAVLGMRIQQGRYSGPAGDKAITDALYPAGELLGYARRNCLLFSDPKKRAAWVDALEALEQK